MIFNWLPKNARCRKVAGVRFFACFAEILRKTAGFLMSARLVFEVNKPQLFDIANVTRMKIFLRKAYFIQIKLYICIIKNERNYKQLKTQRNEKEQ